MARRTERLTTFLGLPWRLARLGATRRDSVRAAVIAYRLLTAQALGRRTRRFYALSLRGPADAFSCTVSELSELLVLDEIFVRDPYEVDLQRDPETIVDLGAHIGASVIYFRQRYPQARIYAFEPHPASFRLLERNVGGLERVQLIQAATGPREGSGTLALGRHSWGARLVASNAEGATSTVPVLTLDGSLRRLGLDSVDLLKLDIEGSEYDVLESFAGLDRTQAILGEIHVAQTGRPAEEVLDRLHDFDVEAEGDPDLQVFFKAVRRHGATP